MSGTPVGYMNTKSSPKINDFVNREYNFIPKYISIGSHVILILFKCCIVFIYFCCRNKKGEPKPSPLIKIVKLNLNIHNQTRLRPCHSYQLMQAPEH
ncbi:MAG: hypothetical protein DRQ40_06885 [Gammaproteobacteria bacterium]|nr:MAG: hypothetical protein DRQ40_06885 [Gammaproteobacteria bacterium]